MTDISSGNVRERDRQMTLVPCFRAEHLHPYIDLLRNIGAPLERSLRRAGLPTLIAAGDDIYLPLFPSLIFLNNITRIEGIDEAPLRAMGKFEIADLGEQFLARVSCVPTLKAALERFRDLVAVEDSNAMFGISYGETAVKLRMSARILLNAQDQYFDDWGDLLVMVAVVRAFAERAWQPLEMEFRSTVIPGRYAAEQFPDTHFITGQKFTSITVPYELLSLPPRVTSDVSQSHASLPAAPPIAAVLGTDGSNSLRAVLSAYLPEQLPDIGLAAEMAGTSIRTLQRRLKEGALSYSGLISEIRFEAAARLLRETDATALEIALEVGYEDPSHFSRAFKRTAGISPREYRRQHRQHQAGVPHNSRSIRTLCRSAPGP